MDPEVPTTLALKLTMGNTVDVLGPYTYRWGDEIPKRGETMPAVRSPGSTQKGVYVMQFLIKGKDIFKAQRIYIYIYIYIWKEDKGVAEIKFCYPMFTCEGKQ